MSLSKLIDTELLTQFGTETIAPLAGAITLLSQTVEAISEKVEDIDSGGGSGEVGARLDDLDQNVLALTLALAIYQQAAVNGTADNIVVEVFSDTSGFILISGEYDDDNHRLVA